MRTHSGRWPGAVALLAAIISLALVPAIPAEAEPNGTIVEYGALTPGSNPADIVTGPDGAMWVTEPGSNQIARLDPTNGAVKEYPLGAAGVSMALGPDGNFWITQQNVILQFNPTTGQVLQYAFSVGGQAAGIATGSDGNLWFSEPGTNLIGRLTPSGLLTEFPLPTPDSQPYGITSGPDGNIWFTQPGAEEIGRITPTGSITEFPLHTSALVDRITTGPDGNLWITEPDTGNIARITPSGVFTEFPSPTSNGNPEFISAGPDGNVWFGETSSSKIGRITPSGTITEFSLPTSTAPEGVTAGPDGNIWFAAHESNEIGRVERAPTVSLSASSLDFGSQDAGTVTTQTLSVSNTGGRPLAVSGVAINGSDAGDFSTTHDTCTAATVAPGGSCTVGISFSPATAGSRNASLILTDNAANVTGTTQSVSLSGVGVANADIAVSLGASPNPAGSGKPLTYSITVSNAGPTDATGVAITDTLPPQSQFVGVKASRGTCITPAKGASGTLTCSLGSLSTGGATTTTVSLTIVAPHKSTVTDTATVTSTSNDPNSANNTASVAVLMK